MKFSLTILGSNSAVPAHNRFPTAQILQFHDKRMLIDCGEGTQFQLNRFKIKRSGLDHIFISHMHGDHYLGLVGLISTLRLNGRKEDLHIYGPPHLEKVLDIQLNIDNREWSFQYIFHPLEFGESKHILETTLLDVYTIPLDHKIECNGFLFKEKPGFRKIIPEKIKEYEIPFSNINDIKAGEDFTLANGSIIKNEELTLEPNAPRSYAYCSDTRYKEDLVPLIKNATLLYHESTFMHDLAQIANDRFHSTSQEAAQIAKMAQVNKLAIGHFSGRYRNLEPMLKEAQATFENTELAIEGTVFEI